MSLTSSISLHTSHINSNITTETTETSQHYDVLGRGGLTGALNLSAVWRPNYGTTLTPQISQYYDVLGGWTKALYLSPIMLTDASTCNVSF